MNNLVIEEPSIKHYEAFKDFCINMNAKYYRDYTMEMFKDFIEFYEECKMPEKGINCFHKIYLLIDTKQNRIIGKLDIVGNYNEEKRMSLPEIAYRIRSDERKKGYGKLLLQLVLENNTIDVDYFYLQIFTSNIPSIKLIKNFNPELIDITTSREDEVQHFIIKNMGRMKKTNN